MFGAIAGGSASALAGGAMSKLFGGGQKAASGGIQGDVLATDNNTVGMGDDGIKSAIQGSNVPNPDEAVPSFVSGAMAKAGKGLLEGTLQAGTSAVSDKLLDLVGLGGKSAAAKGLGAKEWNNSLKTKLSLLPKKLFRIRMSRNFGMKMLTMTNLSTECLIQLTKLGYDATPFNQILKQNAKRE